MKHFPILRTQRLTVQLQELTIGQSIALANMPEHLREAECTTFLNHAVKSSEGIENPLDWTVQERTLVVAHYLASVLEDGPDFQVGEGRYSDYFNGASDSRVETIDLCEQGGERWRLQPLTGRMAEAVERLQGEIEGLPARMHWLLGCMAAQLLRDGESIDNLTEGGFDEWLLNRMRVFQAYPESDFEELLTAYWLGMDTLKHLFAVTIGDGLLILPRQETDGALPPARFPVRAGLSPLAISMGG